VSFSGNAMETKRLEIALERPRARHGTGRPGGTGGGASTAAAVPAGAGKLNVGATGGWCNVTVDGAGRGATPVAGVELSAARTASRARPPTASRNPRRSCPADGTARYKFTL